MCMMFVPSTTNECAPATVARRMADRIAVIFIAISLWLCDGAALDVFEDVAPFAQTGARDVVESRRFSGIPVEPDSAQEGLNILFHMSACTPYLPRPVVGGPPGDAVGDQLSVLSVRYHSCSPVSIPQYDIHQRFW